MNNELYKKLFSSLDFLDEEQRKIIVCEIDKISDDSFEKGKLQGYEDGYNKGFNVGFQEGLRA